MENRITTIGAWKIDCPPEWSWQSDYNQWEGYHFWYVYRGNVSIATKDYVYELKEKEVFLFDLEENHICKHNPETPLGVYAIYFHTTKSISAQIMQKHIADGSLLGKMIEHCVELFEEKEYLNLEIWMKAILTEFINGKIEDTKAHPVILTLHRMCREKMGEIFTLTQMCNETGYSKNQLIRIVKNETGHTPKYIQTQYKMEYAKSLLTYSNENVENIAFRVGFLDTNYFCKVFNKYVGVNPKEYRKRKM